MLFEHAALKEYDGPLAIEGPYLPRVQIGDANHLRRGAKAGDDHREHEDNGS